ncbi:MAG: DUF309 domain-containing protein [Blastocatellia bacterium]
MSDEASSMLPAGWLRGVELFNQGEYFACHEALEPLWLAARGDEKTFLHAVIQLAAALHHWRHGNLKGAGSLCRRAADKLRTVPARMFQLDARMLSAQVAGYLRQTETTANPPRIILSPVTAPRGLRS